MKKKYWLLTAIVALISVVLMACGGGSKDEVKTSGTSSSGKKEVNLMESAEIPSMDSTKGTDGVSFTAQNQVFEGLYYLDKDDKTQPGVAAGDPEMNEDQTVYTIKLRDDAKWSDGSQVTAQDFVYAWQKMVNPATGAEYAVIFDGIVKNATDIISGKKKPEDLGVKALDDTTLEITLEQPVPYFHSLLTFQPFYPQKEEYVKKQGDNYAKDSEHMIYNGAFVMKDWNNTSKTWKFEKNDKYWNKKDIKVDKINVQVVKEPGAAVNLYNTGKLDRATLTGDYAKQKSSDPDYQTDLEAFVYYLKFNQILDGKDTLFKNANARKAFALVLNKEQLVDTVLGNGSKAINGFVPGEFTFNPETDEDFRKESGSLQKTDQKAAKEYWAKAKEELGIDKISIELLADDQDFNKKSSEFIQNALQSNLDGVTIKIKTVPYKSRLQLDENKDYTLQLTRWGPDYQDPITFLNIQTTNNNYNRANYSNKEYDALLAKASGELATKPEERWNTMIQAEKVLLDDAGIAPLYQSGTAVLQKPNVTGVVHHLFGAPYSYKWIEKK
ncbi:oligopeptide ABC transporter oligopeptide- binding protein [Listeria fleischmannii 1991]|uniref:Stage 0 sporulation protein KA n=2 Tax=Listeria fleischmannii TaxID=1069827 RepID=A0A2X3HMD0_9LIST|nr:peptide ABC transporter substrate-binding protein [Listeria fleischmannii]EMG27462.1 oligopeptide ABC transporter oligopeptide- binding protein [Listeria fleischmannii subsp. fleischmannii LU2006-1]KMT59724.1 oligopeptide ABC transporter oligopeptide- binding protein [Listeria fleischmannii 1991]SQC72304.1 Stage 0 sporulation protein KA [Listeria fleischmannii subsp. fleischmannii]